MVLAQIVDDLAGNAGLAAPGDVMKFWHLDACCLIKFAGEHFVPGVVFGVWLLEIPLLAGLWVLEQAALVAASLRSYLD